jgi:hypothetical protein
VDISFLKSKFFYVPPSLRKKMVYDLIAFAAGVYFGFRNHEASLWALIEKGMLYNVALAGILTAAMIFTIKLEPEASFIISILAYLFLAFILGSVAGRVSRRMLRRREDAQENPTP